MAEPLQQQPGSYPFSCPFCDRSFMRQEHCARHVRSHTNTRPFACPVCEKRFGRRDVHQRHIRLQHPEHAPSLTRLNRRTRTACTSCHSRKLKCKLAAESCERCLQEGRECSLFPLSAQSGLLLPDLDRIDDATPPARQERETPDFAPPHGLADYNGLRDLDPAGINFPSPPPMGGSAPARDAVAELLAAPTEFPLDTTPILDAGLFNSLAFLPYMDLAFPYADAETHSELSSTNVSEAHVRLRQYFMPMDCSRPASPTAEVEHESWVQHLGELESIRYDPAVLEIFLRLFQVHLTPTFQCFERPASDRTSPAELTLAMAGVGALYCSTPGSHKLAHSLYNSTRVKLLSKVHHKPPTPTDDRLATLQTYMLLELFGYISGDARLHEIAEVYHCEMVEIVRMYKLWPSNGSNREEERKRTIEGICLLECYRVSILHGSATFSLTLQQPSRGPFDGSPVVEPGGLGEESLFEQLDLILYGDPLSSENQTHVPEPTIWSLSCLSLLLPWASSNSTLYSHQLTPAHMRRREFVESTLNKWSKAAYSQSSHPTKLLFHLVSLNLHINQEQVEQIAQQQCTEASPDEPQLWFMGKRALQRRKRELSPAALFASEVDRLSAAWHASCTMRLVLERKQATDRRLVEEAPHLPYCVFFAALTFWSLDGCSQHVTPSLREPGVDGSAWNEPVPQAINILSHCRSPVARKLLLILQSLACQDR